VCVKRFDFRVNFQNVISAKMLHFYVKREVGKKFEILYDGHSRRKHSSVIADWNRSLRVHFIRMFFSFLVIVCCRFIG